MQRWKGGWLKKLAIIDLKSEVIVLWSGKCRFQYTHHHGIDTSDRPDGACSRVSILNDAIFSGELNLQRINNLFNLIQLNNIWSNSMVTYRILPSFELGSLWIGWIVGKAVSCAYCAVCVHLKKILHTVKFSSLNDIRDNRKDLHYNLQLILMMSNHPLVIVLHMCREIFTCIHRKEQLGEFIVIVYVYWWYLYTKKHRKNCECCPGHYLSTSVY